MFYLDNKSGVKIMPTPQDSVSDVPLWFTEEKDKASYPGADWFNIVTLELLNVLKLGGITPDKFKFNQISLVLSELIAAQSRISDSIEEGIENTTNGQFFSVPQGTESLLSFIYYRNDNGNAIEVARVASDKAIDELKRTTRKDEIEDPFAVIGNDGFSFFNVKNDRSFGTPDTRLDGKGITFQDWKLTVSSRAGLELTDKYGFIYARMGRNSEEGAVIPSDTAIFETVDKYGFIYFKQDTSGNILGIPSNNQGSTDLRYEYRNLKNLAYSQSLKGKVNSELEGLVHGLNLILTYGQSLGEGAEGWPALSKLSSAVQGALMFGDSPRPYGGQIPAYNPVNNSNLNELHAVTQTSQGPILTPEQEATLAPGNTNMGETPDVSAVKFLRMLFLKHHGLLDDNTRIFVAANASVGGKSIEQLSKGATPELYLRTVEAAQKIKSVADARSLSFGVAAMIFIQGEYNYVDYNGTGADTSKDGYKSKSKLLREDLFTDISVSTAEQRGIPAFFTYQTGASFTAFGRKLNIGMAQWEASKEERNWYLATPIYPYTDKGGHLDANGYRWFGNQLGKVMYRVLCLNEQWEPVSPLRWTLDGKVLVGDFHVPEPPLQFRTPYVGLASKDYKNKGFVVTDDNGDVTISSVEIVLDTLVKITLTKDPVGDVYVIYADKETHNGNGCLCDSDTTIAMDNYEYSEGSGQYPDANISELVDKPYPLHNWSIAYRLKAEKTHFGE
ncbi:TPA: hypothetical protein ACIAIE_003315 [Serratia fonticola]